MTHAKKFSTLTPITWQIIDETRIADSFSDLEKKEEIVTI